MAGAVLRRLRYQVEPRDPPPMALAPLVLAIAAFVAILLPVVRHTRVDPISTMRTEQRHRSADRP
jgi:hypothetical protein